MYLKHYQLKQNPFTAHPDDHIFFPGGGRKIVLKHVLEDLSSGMTLIHLSGEKGSGKTNMCQLIRIKLRSTQTIILLSAPSEAINNKGRIFLLALGENDAKHIKETKLYKNILRLISESADNDDSTLLIIDDAEKLSPTVLTPILRLAYDTHQQKGKVQFVLAGRLPLGTNPELFTAIRAEPLQQFTYTLQPLDRNDTARYLAFRLAAAGIPDDKQNGIFSAEAVSKIHEATWGNIRLINILAEEALRNSCKGKSFIVLLDHVKAPSDFLAALPTSINHPSAPRKIPRKIMVCIIALIIIAASWSYNVRLVDTRPKKHSINTPSATIQQAPSLPNVTAAEAPKNDQILAEKLPEAKTPKTEKTKTLLITADKAFKDRHKVQTNVNVDGQPAALEMYQKRTIAGDSWVKGEKNNLYTVQLMALNSRDSEINLKNMFKQKRYLQQAGNFYIFKKMSVPETFFVFYGEYKDMETAQLNQKSLPDFLRTNQPFAISIKKAMAKIRK